MYIFNICVVIRVALAGYNEWREWCGLPRARDFDDLQDIDDPDVRHRLRTLYE